MAHDIELVDREFGHVRVPISRKIKFKGISFTNISKRWNNFRLNRLKSKLIADKEKLVNMEFTNDQLTKGRETTEQKIMKKTTAIAKLESKIQFLETGNYSTEEFINSRAIKLKKVMMSNLVYNRDSLYGLTEAAANEIVNGPSVPEQPQEPVVQTVENDMKEQQEKIAQEVQRIMAEQEAAVENSVENAVETPAEPVKESTQSEMIPEVAEVEIPVSTEKESVAVETEMPQVEIPVEQVNKAEVFDAINEAMSAINVDEQIQREEINNAIEEEMDKIKVSSNESTIAKVNKFINEDGTYRLTRNDIIQDEIYEQTKDDIPKDGTYRLTRDDIPEEFRITSIDRDEMPQTAELPEEEVFIPPFGDNIVRQTPDIEIPRKAITPIPEMKKYVIEPIELPKVNIKYTEDESEIEAETPIEIEADESYQENEVYEETPVETEEESYDASEEYQADEQNENQEESRDVVFDGDIEAMMSRANMLRQDLVEINDQIAAAEQDSETISADYAEAYGRFSAYVAELQSERDSLERKKADIVSINNDRRAQVDAIIAMMENQPVAETNETKHR